MITTYFNRETSTKVKAKAGSTEFVLQSKKNMKNISLSFHWLKIVD